MFTRILDAIQGKAPLSAKRSRHWGRVRATHLLTQPRCQICDGSSKLEVHHIKPFHTHPELELSPSNLITLCSSGKNGMDCHLTMGHHGDYHAANPDIRIDAKRWYIKFMERS